MDKRRGGLKLFLLSRTKQQYFTKLTQSIFLSNTISSIATHPWLLHQATVSPLPSCWVAPYTPSSYEIGLITSVCASSTIRGTHRQQSLFDRSHKDRLTDWLNLQLSDAVSAWKTQNLQFWTSWIGSSSRSRTLAVWLTLLHYVVQVELLRRALSNTRRQVTASTAGCNISNWKYEELTWDHANRAKDKQHAHRHKCIHRWQTEMK